MPKHTAKDLEMQPTGQTQNSWAVPNPMRFNRKQSHAVAAALGMVMVDRVNNGLSALPQEAHRAIQASMRQRKPKKGSGENQKAGLLKEAKDRLPAMSEQFGARSGSDTSSLAPSLSSEWDDDEGDDEPNDLDPSLIFSMERTVLSAYNQAFQIMMVGGGLMAVGAKNDDTPIGLGIVIFVSGIIYGAISYGLHIQRLNALRRGEKITMFSSAAWIGALMLFATIGMSIELYYAIVYPYLERAQEVSFSSDSLGGRGVAANATLP
jgi:hypothetical protein